MTPHTPSRAGPSSRVHRRYSRGEVACAAWLFVLWCLTAWAPASRRDWLLENLLVFIAVGVLALTYRRFRFSTRAYALFTVFLSLHLVGAHYTYSATPLGFWLQDALALPRNHYDRIVHFTFGFLLVVPFRELLLRAAGVRRGWSYGLAVMMVLALSALYEAIEGAVAMVVSPELGAAWLGTQGDAWDAQKDAALAGLGAVLTMGAAWWRGRTARTRRVSRS